MQWTLSKITRNWFTCLALLLFMGVPIAQAQGLETIMAPGKLIQGHAKVEDDCKQCHVKFDRKAQDGLCMSCHKPVGVDVREKTGFHGRLPDGTCRSCHTDHKGREQIIVNLDKSKFDHTKTDFLLKGKHAKLECTQCHVGGKKYREAAMECAACHKKDDTHKGSLGAKCADCHSESTWKDAKFDHDTTRFALLGKHLDAKCTDCHKGGVYKGTPLGCVSCHKKDDEQKGHKGSFGERCDSCHTAKQWKSTTFNHDTDTRYALRGKHRSAGCKDCHTGNVYRDKLSQECYACHKKDDKHKETLGKDCASCHSERSWKEPPKFDHDSTAFPLLGKHVKAECKSCHDSVLFKQVPKTCSGCHTKDDAHKTTLGADCAACHSERSWKGTDLRFKHEVTRFPLRNGHSSLSVKCAACHSAPTSYRNTPLDCYSCHKKDDKHQGQLGTRCESCHSDTKWRTTVFDHNLSAFPLTGRHINVPCKSCHESTKFKDSPKDCVSCHAKADKHKARFGEKCDSCHNTRSWLAWNFNHDTRTKFALAGRHLKTTCESCHQSPAPKGRSAAPLSGTCIACHRSDDVHDGQFGGRCDQCHGVETWKGFKPKVGMVHATGDIA